MKTNELKGDALDWAVATATGNMRWDDDRLCFLTKHDHDFAPSTDWAQGGPIIEREIAKIERFSDALWEATAYTKDAQDIVQSGPTSLIAAMRCYVASKLGDNIDIPKELGA